MAGVAVSVADVEETPEQTKGTVKKDFSLSKANARLSNSDLLNDLSSKLSHLTEQRRRELEALLEKYLETMNDTPTQTSRHAS